MNHLMREKAPITDPGWEAIDEEASRTLRHFCAARKVVDFKGPLGWGHSAEILGRAEPLDAPPAEGVEGGVRRLAPLVELRVPFEVDRRELEAIDRGSLDYDLDVVVDAARTAALAEDRLVFHGYPEASIRGIAEGSTHDAVAINDDYDDYPRSVAKGVAALRFAGVDGPYALALGPRCYTGVIETTHMGGYPVLEHLRLIAGGPVVWAPAVDGAVVVSLRGGDHELAVGQDFAIGYRSHDDDVVRLYLEESITFRLHGPEAGIALTYS